MQTFRLRRLHLLGSNARIYIAQECTTRGSRRLHLLMQEHNPRHACTKKIHAPQLACAKRRVHLSCARSKDARVAPYTRAKDIRAPPCCVCAKMHAPPLMRASKACARRPLPACAKDGRAKGRACIDARAAATRVTKMRASEQL